MSRVPTLSDGVVTLRAHREEDVPAIVEQCRDALSQEWTTVPVPYSDEDAQAFVADVVRAGWGTGRSWAFAVETDGEFGGTVELRDEGHGRAEIAFGSHPRVRGTGVMERACRLLLDWGFGDRDVQMVIWRAFEGNWASRKLAWRLGFTFDGTVRRRLPQRGELRDAWVGTLLPDDERKPRGHWLDVPVLDAGGLCLRPLRDSDVPRIVEACRDERTQTWLGSLPDPYDETAARTWLQIVDRGRASGRGAAWAVADPHTDLLLGAISYFDFQPEVELEIGFWAHPDARGRGVMTRAMAEVVRYAFEDLGVRRVTAGAAVGNTASAHVIQSSGLRPWGTERLGTVVHAGRADVVWYDVLVEEWRRLRAV
jgi:RimJ/RimL family protein N-acetyltransferase